MSAPSPFEGQQIIRFGVGGKARRAASRYADQLWESGVAARALFRPEYGGWAVVTFALPPRRKPERPER